MTTQSLSSGCYTADTHCRHLQEDFILFFFPAPNPGIITQGTLVKTSERTNGHVETFLGVDGLLELSINKFEPPSAFLSQGEQDSKDGAQGKLYKLYNGS